MNTALLAEMRYSRNITLAGTEAGSFSLSYIQHVRPRMYHDETPLTLWVTTSRCTIHSPNLSNRYPNQETPLLLKQLLQEQERWCQSILENFAKFFGFFVHYFTLSLPFRFPLFAIVLTSFPKVFPRISCHVAEGIRSWDTRRHRRLISIFHIKGSPQPR